MKGGPDKFNSNFVPEDLGIIGAVIGDGEVICFSTSGGTFVNYFEGRTQNERISFDEVLSEMTDDAPIISKSRIAEILAQLEVKEREKKSMN